MHIIRVKSNSLIQLRHNKETIRYSPSLAFFVDFSNTVFLNTVFFWHLRKERNMRWQLAWSHAEKKILEIAYGKVSTMWAWCVFVGRQQQKRGGGLSAPQKSGQIILECVWSQSLLLTASRRPDSVGVLSMSASNTSSAHVLTYSRTIGKREKE